ncbi:MAG: MCE family protein [Rhodobacteraceae bacterium]|nr:MCE family protein [Paracoccaceae bacterium]
MNDPVPGEPDIQPGKGGLLSGLSLIWLVPVVAIGITLAMVWQAYSDRGPQIEIVFDNAEGVVANETVLKYRNVDIGKVEEVHFADDLRKVIVSVRLDKSIAQYADSKAQFWIVRPEVSAQGISGLTTLLGGVFLEASLDEKPGEPQMHFTGLSGRPLISGNEKGIEFVLSAPSGGTIEAGAPIIYKGVSVGLIDRPELSADGKEVTAKAFVRAPYDQLVTTNSRFWGASGVRVDLSTSGLQVDIANLSALIQGGLEFEDMEAGGGQVEKGHVFSVYASRDAASSDTTTVLAGPSVSYAAIFDSSILGLSIGAPIQYQGLTIGTVTGTSGVVSGVGAAAAVEMRVDMRIVPGRLGIDGGDIEAKTASLMKDLVAQGWRVRLAGQGLLGMSLKVDLVKVADAPPEQIVQGPDGTPILPRTKEVSTDLAETARTAMNRLQALPIERIADSVAELLDNLNQVVASNAVREAPGEVVGLVGDLRSVVTSEAVKGAVSGASDSLTSLSQILEQMREGGAVANLISIIDEANGIAQSLDQTATGLPQLTEKLSNLADTAASLPLDKLIDQADAVLASANGLIQSPGVQGLPEQLGATLQELDKAVSNVTGITQRVADSTALTNLLAALDRTDSISRSIDQTSQGLPALVDKINAVASEAQALPLDQLVTSATDLVNSANALVSSDDTARLPAALGSALDQVAAALAELREGGAVNNLNTTLASASSAADAISQAAARLPELANRLDALSQQAQGVLAAYDSRSPFNSQTVTALRDLSVAARAVTSLAQFIERKPNALLIGR